VNRVNTTDVLCYIDASGQLQRPLPAWAEPELLVWLYRQMMLVREYDKKAIALQRTGKLGTYPSHLGAEAVGIATGHAMAPDDVYIPYYRDMPALLMRGVPMEANLLYWGGDERGSNCYGPDSRTRHDLPFCVPIASQCPHAVGVAAALKIQGDHRAAVVTCGDGATSKGDFLESINCAGVWHLPLVFVVNNNQWAISVPRRLQCGASTLVAKAIGAGISGLLVDGNDLVAVYEALRQALERARCGKGASMIEAISYRLGDHTTADDASRYRSEEELAEAWTREPLSRMRVYLSGQGLWNDNQQRDWQHTCQQQVNEAVERYLAMEPEPPESMFDNLYGELPRELQSQRDALISEASRREERDG